jgi:putative transposase
MRIVGLPKPFYYVSRRSPIEMSEAARQRLWRLKTWQRLRAEGYSAQKAADLLRLPRSTLYRWQKRLDKRGLIGLEDGDRRPKRVRRPQWSPELAEAVLKLREAHPGMGKEKLWVLLRRKDIHTSVSTVGRILKRLKARGVLREPPRNGITKRKRRLVRPYATRKPKEYCAKKPGDLVQVDTLDVRPLSHVRFKQFEQACADKDIRLFVLPPRSPKLNGHVERAQRTHSEEFYDLYMGELDLKSVNEALREWEHYYNTVRPHHSLDLKTPAEYLYENYSDLAPIPKPSHMS